LYTSHRIWNAPINSIQIRVGDVYIRLQVEPESSTKTTTCELVTVQQLDGNVDSAVLVIGRSDSSKATSLGTASTTTGISAVITAERPSCYNRIKNNGVG